MNLNLNSQLVSVYIPTCNRCDLLKRAVNSVLNQTYKNIELVIVNNGSTDETHEYLENLKLNKVDNLQVIHFDENKGGCVARNAGIIASRGKFVTGLDDDDYFLPNRIQIFKEQWDKKKPDTVALYSYSLALGIEKDSLFKYKIATKATDLFVTNTIGNQVFMLRSDAIEAGLYDESLLAFQDIDMWYRLLNLRSDLLMINVKKCTYVFDRSHVHERISTKKEDNIQLSINLILNKYKPGFINSCRFRLQEFKYQKKIKHIYFLFFSFSLKCIFKIIKLTLIKESN